MRKKLIFLTLIVILMSSCASKSVGGFAPEIMMESDASMSRGAGRLLCRKYG